MENVFIEFKEKEVKNVWAITGGGEGGVDRTSSGTHERER